MKKLIGIAFALAATQVFGGTPEVVCGVSQNVYTFSTYYTRGCTGEK